MADVQRMQVLVKEGHTPHCANRMVVGDGECECGFIHIDKDFVERHKKPVPGEDDVPCTMETVGITIDDILHKIEDQRQEIIRLNKQLVNQEQINLWLQEHFNKRVVPMLQRLRKNDEAVDYVNRLYGGQDGFANIPDDHLEKQNAPIEQDDEIHRLQNKVESLSADIGREHAIQHNLRSSRDASLRKIKSQAADIDAQAQIIKNREDSFNHMSRVHVDLQNRYLAVVGRYYAHLMEAGHNEKCTRNMVIDGSKCTCELQPISKDSEEDPKQTKPEEACMVCEGRSDCWHTNWPLLL